MKGLKQFGAMALAAALTITLVAPISASAAIYMDQDGATGNKTYTNEDTKESFTSSADLEFGDDIASALAKTQKVYYISTNDYADIKLSTTIDVAKFTGFKSNKKKALKVRVEKTEEVTKGSNAWITDSYAYAKKENGTWKYYYKDVNNEWKSTDEDGLKKLGENSGKYTIRLYAKKPGTYKIKYNAVDANGATIAKKTIKVVARDDSRAIKSITYGGKNILPDTDGDGRDDYTNYYSVTKRSAYTTKKKGKLVITANKDFKIKKIEIGTPVLDTRNLETTNPTGTQTYGNKPIDLNGNGRTDDIVKGVDESSVSMTWKKVKNKKTIKLSKVEDNEAGNYNKSWKSGKTEVLTEKGNFAPTTIRVTVYDKKNKTTSTELYPIFLRVRK
ncbi:hypothetical protein [Butyrivibrio sp. XPD2002]|uniref:hypothetical protein n=1 Tax=Butyrivibrio sp. XPD2002 TaxID=1280665 RepID=UPI0003F81888|nr:hypothetical protein [Butyrivibrio sp. XPD2002]